MTNITITAKLNNITFSAPIPSGASQTCGYAVEKFILLEDSAPFKKGQTVAVVGENLPVAKIAYRISGQISQSKKYGIQIRANIIEELPTDTTEGIMALLTSCIKGVGQKTAQSIVGAFGNETIDVIEKNHSKLSEVKGISAKKADAIYEAYIEHKGLGEIVKMLAPLGFSNNKINKIFEKFQDKAMDVIKSTPFELCKISGISFSAVDELAKQCGYPLDADDRCEAALYQAVINNESNGNVYADAEFLKKRAFELLGCEKVTNSQLNIILKKMDENKRIKIYASRKDNKVIVYSKAAAYSEIFAAKKLSKLVKNNKSVDVPAGQIEQWEQASGLSLSDEQKEAVKNALGHSVSVITGGPGTGKTTIIKCIADQFSDMGRDILMLAPTGCAARRITRSTGYGAMTIHSALELKPNEDGATNASNIQLSTDVVIVDEASMLDMFIAETLISSLKDDAQLVLIGDADQLPSVRAGAVLSEIINSGVVSVSKLSKVYRTKGSGLIAENAKKICAGDTNLEFDKTNFVFLEANSDIEAAEKMKSLYLNELFFNSAEDVAMLSPFRDKSAACVETLNNAVHDFANGVDHEHKKEVKACGKLWREWDLVMQTKNTETAANGEIGHIRKIDLENKEFTVDFYTHKATYPFTAFEMFNFAYSMSIHKSQGSEYDVVIIDILKMHKTMLARNLIYTGITRAKKKVVIVGQKEALDAAILNTNYSRRNTFFGARLKSEVAKAA